MEEGFDAWNSLAKPIINKNYKMTEVNAMQIDKMEEIGIDFNKSSLVKIDVEGWELKALRGGEITLKQIDAPVLMVEFGYEQAQNVGSSCWELYNYLVSLGYSLYKYDITMNSLSPAHNAEYYYENLIATKDLDMTQRRLNEVL